MTIDHDKLRDLGNKALAFAMWVALFCLGYAITS